MVLAHAGSQMQGVTIREVCMLFTAKELGIIYHDRYGIQTKEGTIHGLAFPRQEASQKRSRTIVDSSYVLICNPASAFVMPFLNVTLSFDFSLVNA
jgi:hypothetical protein